MAGLFIILIILIKVLYRPIETNEK